MLCNFSCNFSIIICVFLVRMPSCYSVWYTFFLSCFCVRPWAYCIAIVLSMVETSSRRLRNIKFKFLIATNMFCCNKHNKLNGGPTFNEMKTPKYASFKHYARKCKKTILLARALIEHTSLINCVRKMMIISITFHRAASIRLDILAVSRKKNEVVNWYDMVRSD